MEEIRPGELQILGVVHTKCLYGIVGVLSHHKRFW